MSDDIAADQLRLFIERIERLEEEKKAMADDIRDVYAEAKSQRLRRQDDARDRAPAGRWRRNARQEAEAMLDTYKAPAC